MKKFQFKQAICLSVGEGNAQKKQTFSLGVHDVSADFEVHPYFAKLLEAGVVVEAGAEKSVAKQMTQAERAKVIHDGIQKQKLPKKPVDGDAPSKAPEAKPEKKAKG